MTKSLTSTLAAALIASAAFGGAALAAGDYYEGASKDAATVAVDTVRTHSTAKNNGHLVLAQNDQANINRGDYYEGANRPN
ncbi:hypothetical protein [Rhizobium sp. LC145]|uniref:hypothetical protein n=1 Tax=Rhizobium sp. LC145 TaxID=1120688 RepID=UPI00062A158D|nr:hypothetical protein [Rhizobium sp. LC145]KKX28818.1 hypothetical protein YH62_17960 [Rhizobium sp. LC145]TKT46316.1 hypothetical protein FDR95_22785 [Rhizobiaceae bacterium LC148]